MKSLNKKTIGLNPLEAYLSNTLVPNPEEILNQTNSLNNKLMQEQSPIQDPKVCTPEINTQPKVLETSNPAQHSESQNLIDKELNQKASKQELAESPEPANTNYSAPQKTPREQIINQETSQNLSSGAPLESQAVDPIALSNHDYNQQTPMIDAPRFASNQRPEDRSLENNYSAPPHASLSSPAGHLAPSTNIYNQIYNNLNTDLHVKKQRVTIHVSEQLIDRVKNAVFWEPGLTLAAFAEMALAETLERFEQERGAPFPSRREKQLRGGRPLK